MEELLHWPIFRLQHRTELHSIKVAHIYNGGNEALYCNNKDQVFQLEMDSSFQISEFVMDDLCGKGVIAFYRTVENTFAALTKTGVVYGWGNNKFGQLADATTKWRQEPAVCEAFRKYKMVDLALTSARTFGLTDDGSVVWCGMGSNQNVCVTSVNDVIGIRACGTYYVRNSDDDPEEHGGYLLCLTKNGQVLMMKSTDSDLKMVNEYYPHFTSSTILQSRVIQIAVGKDFAMVLTEKGEIFGMGSNLYGQMGKEQAEHLQVFTGIKSVGVNANTRYTEIAANSESRSAAAMSTAGTIFAWGRCRGIASLTNFPTPTKLKSLDSVFSVLDKPSKSCLRNLRPLEKLPAASLVFNNPLKSDCVFKVKGRKIHANKSVLMLQLDYFDTMLKGAWKESKGVIKIDGYSYDTYYAFLDYLHNGCFQVDDPFELLRLAHEVQHDVLVEECVTVCRRSLTDENVCMAYHAAKAFGLETLVTSCRRRALMDLEKVLQSKCYAMLTPDEQQEFIYAVVGNSHVEAPQN